MTTAPAAATAATSTPDAQPRPGQPSTRTYRGLTAGDWLIRVVLAAVMTAALAVGTWSIYTLLTHQFAAPQAVAILGCGMFDVAALFFALLSQRYAVTTDSGLAPRTAMLAMISLSSWINWQHGQMEGWGTVGSVILSAAPVIAELSFEMFHRYAHREALRRLGRVAQALPVLGKWAWLAHPFRSRRAVDAHIRAALTEHEALAERREELAVERARATLSVSALNTPALTEHEPLTERAQVPALTRQDAQALTPTAAPERERPTLTPRAERPALSSERAQQNQDAQPPAAGPALTPPEAPAERPTAKAPERAQLPATSSERPSGAHQDAQSAPSLTDRKALKERQDALTLNLYTALNARPEWTEIRDALTEAGLGSVSRPTAQRIRERVESAHPELTGERGALTGTN